mgnify:CR=1 FL=1
MIINLTNIDSSIISEVIYNDSTEELVIEYLGANRYSYKDVPESEFFNIMNAESKGKQINLIKKEYECNKIEVLDI